MSTRKKIVYIDDHEDSCELFKTIVQEHYEILTYNRGREGMEAIRCEKPDVVFLDISLEDISGIEILHRMQNDPALRHICAIALTAHAMKGDREKYLAMGFTGYISKPLADESVLFEAIDLCLKKR